MFMGITKIIGIAEVISLLGSIQHDPIPLPRARKIVYHCPIPLCITRNHNTLEVPIWCRLYFRPMLEGTSTVCCSRVKKFSF